MPETTEYMVGARIALQVGAPAHGGHCVARTDGMVVFVRQALPGEQVIGEITEVRRGYLRADAVEIHTASPDRVAPPCPYARPGQCGGCDLQHASVTGQLAWKASVVAEALTRLGGLTEPEVAGLELAVTALPGGPLGWRTRVRYHVSGNRAGLLAHRSHRLVPIERCAIAQPLIQRQPVTGQRWPGAEAVSVVAGAGSEVSIVAHPHRRAPQLVTGPANVRMRAVGRDWWLPPEVFWQGHPAAADTLAEAVVLALAPRPGEACWDLYGGAGLFAAALAAAGAGRVTVVESDPAAVNAARGNLSDLPSVQVHRANVATALRRRQLPTPVDLVVLDPPRAGAGAAVVGEIVAAAPRAVSYVACDPAAFARDLRTFRKAGWRLAGLRAFDCFPMTHHIELVGLLTAA